MLWCVRLPGANQTEVEGRNDNEGYRAHTVRPYEGKGTAERS